MKKYFIRFPDDTGEYIEGECYLVNRIKDLLEFDGYKESEFQVYEIKKRVEFEVETTVEVTING